MEKLILRNIAAVDCLELQDGLPIFFDQVVAAGYLNKLAKKLMESDSCEVRAMEGYRREFEQEDIGELHRLEKGIYQYSDKIIQTWAGDKRVGNTQAFVMAGTHEGKSDIIIIGLRRGRLDDPKIFSVMNLHLINPDRRPVVRMYTHRNGTFYSQGKVAVEGNLCCTISNLITEINQADYVPAKDAEESNA